MMSLCYCGGHCNDPMNNGMDVLNHLVLIDNILQIMSIVFKIGNRIVVISMKTMHWFL